MCCHLIRLEALPLHSTGQRLSRPSLAWSLVRNNQGLSSEKSGRKENILRKREHQVKIYMNSKEFKELEDKCKFTGQSKQVFILNAIEGVTIATPEEVDILRVISDQFNEYMRVLRGMATNINQQAKHANETGQLETIKELQKQTTRIEKIRKEGEEIWQSLRRLIKRQIHTAR